MILMRSFNIIANIAAVLAEAIEFVPPTLHLLFVFFAIFDFVFYLTAALLNFPLFFFNDTATTEIYTLSLHDALPISQVRASCLPVPRLPAGSSKRLRESPRAGMPQSPHPSRVRPAACPVAAEIPRPLWCKYRSEEHTSELQSLTNIVCRLLLEKKNNESKSGRHLHTKDERLDAVLWYLSTGVGDQVEHRTLLDLYTLQDSFWKEYLTHVFF